MAESNKDDEETMQAHEPSNDKHKIPVEPADIYSSESTASRLQPIEDACNKCEFRAKVHSSDEKVRLVIEYQKFLEETKWLNVEEEVKVYYKCSPPLQKLIRIRSGQDSALVQRVNPPSEEESRTLDKERAVFQEALKRGTLNLTRSEPSPELLAFLQEIKDLWTYEQKLNLLDEYPFHVKEEILEFVNPRVDVSKLRSGEVKICAVDIYMREFGRAHEGNEDAVRYHRFDSDIKIDASLIYLIH